MIGRHRKQRLIDYERTYQEEDIEKDLERQRVCCFCKRENNPILWAHCADGFKGICIAFQIVPQSGSAEHAFTCRPGVTFYPVQCDGIAKLYKSASYPVSTTRRILLQKTQEWSVEDEYRIISEERYIPFGNQIRMTKILLGPRIEPRIRPVWRTVFKSLTDSLEVEIAETTINNVGRVEIVE